MPTKLLALACSPEAKWLLRLGEEIFLINRGPEGRRRQLFPPARAQVLPPGPAVLLSFWPFFPCGFGPQTCLRGRPKSPRLW